MAVKIIESVFDPWQEIHTYQDQHLQQHRKYGATTSFVGTMRDFNQDTTVHSMILEHYPEMTKKYIEKIESEARQKWPVPGCLVIHRFGEILPDEPIMMVTVWTAHRAEGFEACRYIVDELKARAPFWKKEQLDNGQRWVD